MASNKLRSLTKLIPIQLWLFILLSALLQTLPFPLAGPVPIWRAVFSWVAILPLLYALLGTDKLGAPITIWQSSMMGYVCGFLWFMGDCYWIYPTMHVYGGLDQSIAVGILVLFCLYLGLYYALFGMLIGIIRCSSLGRQGALLLSPFIWVTVELARARITGFPWDLLGVTQVNNPLLIRLAPVTGVYGISFVIIGINALWLLRIRIREKRHTRLILTVSGFATIIYFIFLINHSYVPVHLRTTNTVTLVQENLSVGQEARGIYESPANLISSFSRLSLSPPSDWCLGIPEMTSTQCLHFISPVPSLNSSPMPTNLVVWPESPAGFRTDDPYFQRNISALAKAVKAPLVIGSLGVVPDALAPRGARVYDSAALVTADGMSAGRYDKVHLVPWGEYIPYKQIFFFAKKLTAGVGDMDRGKNRAVFNSGGHTFGVFICYESIFGDEVRQFVNNGAEVLINISDDGWYGDTSAAWQHLNMVRMRAIENHRWILRSTNTGVTAVIDPYGHVTASAPRHIRTALHAGYNYERGTTFYTRHGDLFAYLCALITVLAVSYSMLQKNQLN